MSGNRGLRDRLDRAESFRGVIIGNDDHQDSDDQSDQLTEINAPEIAGEIKLGDEIKQTGGNYKRCRHSLIEGVHYILLLAKFNEKHAEDRSQYRGSGQRQCESRTARAYGQNSQ